MGAPIGNQNAAKAKQWAAAVERAIERFGNGKKAEDVLDQDAPARVRGLDMLADQFVANVLKEGVSGFRELADRLDGRPAQQLIHSGDEDAPLLTKVVREVSK